MKSCGITVRCCLWHRNGMNVKALENVANWSSASMIVSIHCTWTLFGYEVFNMPVIVTEELTSSWENVNVPIDVVVLCNWRFAVATTLPWAPWMNKANTRIAYRYMSIGRSTNRVRILLFIWVSDTPRRGSQVFSCLCFYHSVRIMRSNWCINDQLGWQLFFAFSLRTLATVKVLWLINGCLKTVKQSRFVLRSCINILAMPTSPSRPICMQQNGGGDLLSLWLKEVQQVKTRFDHRTE